MPRRMWIRLLTGRPDCRLELCVVPLDLVRVVGLSVGSLETARKLPGGEVDRGGEGKRFMSSPDIQETCESRRGQMLQEKLKRGQC